VQQVEVALIEDGIAGATSLPFIEQGHEKSQSSAMSDLYLTTIEDHSGGMAQLIHVPSVAILCLNRAREVLEIPFQIGAG
jgi:hypothetical protein